MPIVPIIPLRDSDLEKVLHNVVKNGIDSGIDTWGEATEDDIHHAVVSAAGSARQAITNLSGVILHGVTSTDSNGDISHLVECMCDGDVVNTLKEITTIMDTWDSPDPVFIASSVAETLTRRMKNNNVPNPLQCAETLTRVAVLVNDVTTAMQSSVFCARVAACVVNPTQVDVIQRPDPNSQPEPTDRAHGEKKDNGVRGREPSHTAGETRGAESNSHGRENTSSGGSNQRKQTVTPVKNTTKKSQKEKNRVESSGGDAPRMAFRVSSEKDVDRVITFILGEDRYGDIISDEVFDVLDDDGMSEWSYQDGNLIIDVFDSRYTHGGDIVQKVYDVMSQIVSNVIVRGDSDT